MAQKIQVKRGLEVNLGSISLADGEFAVTTDTHKLYVGVSGVKYCIGSASSLGDMLKSIYDTDNDGVVDNAEMAAKLATARKINGVAFDGSSDITITANPNAHTHTSIIHNDTRSTDFAPTAYDGLSVHLKANGIDSLTDGGTYHAVVHIQQWTDTSGGAVHQLAFTDNGNIFHRKSASATTWGTWEKLLTNKQGLTWNTLKGV